eukprot:4229643-Prorocentrum_lima.AAC.1
MLKFLQHKQAHSNVRQGTWKCRVNLPTNSTMNSRKAGTLPNLHCSCMLHELQPHRKQEALLS